MEENEEDERGRGGRDESVGEQEEGHCGRKKGSKRMEREERGLGE